MGADKSNKSYQQPYLDPLESLPKRQKPSRGRERRIGKHRHCKTSQSNGRGCCEAASVPAPVGRRNLIFFHKEARPAILQPLPQSLMPEDDDFAAVEQVCVHTTRDTSSPSRPSPANTLWPFSQL